MINVGEAELLLITAGSSSASWQLLMQDRLGVHEQAAGRSVLLACAHATLQFDPRDDVSVQRLGVNPLCKLLAFLDEASAIRVRSQSSAIEVILPFDPLALDPARGLEHWFLRQFLQGDAQIEALACFLRHLESYWLVRFLIAESSRLKNVGSLGNEYGLSYSHFRRVCKTVLGRSVKAELKVWRAARSLLEAIAGSGTMTEVAIRNGYASSSHFSTEIKKLFGRSPRAITVQKF